MNQLILITKQDKDLHAIGPFDTVLNARRYMLALAQRDASNLKCITQQSEPLSMSIVDSTRTTIKTYSIIEYDAVEPQ